MRPFPLVFVLGLSVVGCGDLRRVRECRAFAEAVNAAAADVEGASQGGAGSYRAAAQRYRALVRDLASAELSAPGGEEVRKDYLAALEPIPAAMETYAQGLGRPNPGDPARSVREIDRLARREKVASNKISQYCRTH